MLGMGETPAGVLGGSSQSMDAEQAQKASSKRSTAKPDRAR
jgi:hypothetical protein